MAQRRLTFSPMLRNLHCRVIWRAHHMKNVRRACRVLDQSHHLLQMAGPLTAIWSRGLELHAKRQGSPNLSGNEVS